jgi:hypothetical protein
MFKYEFLLKHGAVVGHDRMIVCFIVAVSFIGFLAKYPEKTTDLLQVTV